jgi:hypothetical protein
MRELLQLAWDILLFKDDAYAQHVARADVLKRGLLLLVVVTLLSGVVSLLVGVIGDLRPVDVAAQRQEAEQTIQDLASSLDVMREYFDVSPKLAAQVLAYTEAAIEMGLRLEGLPTRLPKPLGRVLQDLGAFLSLPFSRLAGWVGYSIWVLLVAKLLGGRATTAQTLGATALYAVPHVLDVLAPVPCLGSVLGLVALVWGIAIYVKALAVVNDFSIGRAPDGGTGGWVIVRWGLSG